MLFTIRYNLEPCMKLVRYLLVLSCLFAFSSCINFKSEYPEIKFYRLHKEPSSLEKLERLDASIQIRNFTIADEYDTDRIIARYGDDRVQPYYYSRWIASFDDLATDFLVASFNESGKFKGGAIKSNTLLAPEFIIEGRVLHAYAYNTEKKESDTNFVECVINVNLLKRSEDKPGLEQLFNKNYSQKIIRKNSNSENIADAMSMAMSQISDMILVDLYSNIKRIKQKN